MYIVVLLAPLLSFLLIYLIGGFMGSFGVGFFAVFCMLSTFVGSCFIFFEVIIMNMICVLDLMRWMGIFPFELKWSFNFDTLSAIMLVMILFISSGVHIYSLSYMQNDINKNRFMALLSLFTFFMLFLVTSNNFVQLLLGWEGVGLCSYLLVNFWADRILANRAALKALFFNRVGDFGMILALIYVFYYSKSLSFLLVFDIGYILSFDTFFEFKIDFLFLKFQSLFEDREFFSGFIFSKLDIICLFFVLAAIAKSAQFFLHGWLSDAMEGPTPVSALIHAATMVTAGIFLITRISPLIQYSLFLLNIIIILGLITTIIFSFSGSFNNDLKKIVASSTASQLAYMFFIAGLLDLESSVFHLFLHAFFKALLFLSAGSIIHSLNDEQDIRKMGGLLMSMPFNSFCFLIGSFSLIGLPLATGGYYSKDLIVENTWVVFNDYFDDLINLGSEWGVFNTFYYNLKLSVMVFFGSFRGFLNSKLHDGPQILIFSMLLIVFGSMVAPLFWEFLVSEDSFISQNFTEIMNYLGEGDLSFYREEEILVYLMCILFILGFIVFLHVVEISFKNQDSLKLNNVILYYNYYYLVLRFDYIRWGLEYFIVKFLIKIGNSLSDFYFILLDRGFLEKIGSFFVIKFINKFLFFFVSLNSGFIYRYVFLFISTVILVVIFIICDKINLILINLFIYFFFFFFFTFNVFFFFVFLSFYNFLIFNFCIDILKKINTVLKLYLKIFFKKEFFVKLVFFVYDRKYILNNK